jgi:hypothetical protein
MFLNRYLQLISFRKELLVGGVEVLVNVTVVKYTNVYVKLVVATGELMTELYSVVCFTGANTPYEILMIRPS